MSLFCFLWVPLFYLFRRSITAEGGGGGVWALLLGSLSAIMQLIFGPMVASGGFGFSRWLFVFVDMVSVPALVPLLVYAVFYITGLFSGGAGFANFALLWLIPVAALRAISWSSQSDPLLLVITPLLWTAIIVGIPFFIHYIVNYFRWYVIILASLGILALPLVAATSWWALYSHQNILGFSLFFVGLLPMLVSVALDYMRGGSA